MQASHSPPAGVRRLILDAGTALLRDDGLFALTQPRIAKAAGVSQSHLTYYFPTRDRLMLAIAQHSVEQELGQLGNAPGTDPKQALATAMRFLPRVRMMLGLLASGDRDPDIRPEFARLVAYMRSALGQILIRLGYQLDAPQVLVFHAAVIGLAMMNLGRQSAESEREIDIGLAQLLALLPSPPDDQGDIR
ncbi:MAG: TetR/AcrR family transcriptional regulator [Proteobacteria bacterium]|nr:TetR/AcrR family transcriptional regulator [Pseudomonadota bacterium]